MMDIINLHESMLATVATALGPELLPEIAFVGGSTTGLLLTDPFTKEQVRYTDDVDVIVGILGRVAWHRFESEMRKRGFTPRQGDSLPNAPARPQGRFMPDDAEILGYTNRWYSEALQTAQWHRLTDGTTIRLVTPPYFLATKLEAYRGRGNNDPLMSHDIEDILNLLDGRPELINEISHTANRNLLTFIAVELKSLLANPHFEYAVQGSCRDAPPGREELLFERIDTIIGLE